MLHQHRAFRPLVKQKKVRNVDAEEKADQRNVALTHDVACHVVPVVATSPSPGLQALLQFLQHAKKVDIPLLLFLSEPTYSPLSLNFLLASMVFGRFLSSSCSLSESGCMHCSRLQQSYVIECLVTAHIQLSPNRSGWFIAPSDCILS